MKSLGGKESLLLYVEVETSGFNPILLPANQCEGSTNCIEIKLSSPHGRKLCMVEGK